MSNTAGEPGGTFGAELKRRRLALGWRQEDLADAAGVSRWSVMRWETGDTKGEPAAIAATAAAVGMDPVDAFRRLGWLPVDPDAVQPRRLPIEIDRLLVLHDRAPTGEREVLLERVEWVTEWFESRLAKIETQNKARKRAG